MSRTSRILQIDDHTEDPLKGPEIIRAWNPSVRRCAPSHKSSYTGGECFVHTKESKSDRIRNGIIFHEYITHCYTYFTSMCYTLLHIFHKYVLHTVTHISWVYVTHCYAFFMSVLHIDLFHEYVSYTVTHIFTSLCYTYFMSMCNTLFTFFMSMCVMSIECALLNRLTLGC